MMGRLVLRLPAAALLAAATADAALVVPPVFADGLVLQSWVEGDARSFVYGSASALAAVNVTMTSADPAQPYEKVYSTQASSLGAWSVQVDCT